MSDYFIIRFIAIQGGTSPAGFTLLKELINITSETAMCYLWFKNNGDLKISVEYDDYLDEILQALINYSEAFDIIESRIFLVQNSLSVNLTSTKQLKDLQTLLKYVDQGLQSHGN